MRLPKPRPLQEGMIKKLVTSDIPSRVSLTTKPTGFLFSTNKNNETLVIAPFSSTLTWQDLKPPKRDFSNQKGYSSILFIPGLGLNLKGIPIAPTPHAVKSQEETRYAVIVFAMIPNFEVTYDQIRVSMN